MPIPSHIDFPVNKIVQKAIPQSPRQRATPQIPLTRFRHPMFRTSYFLTLYPQSEQKHIFKSFNLSEASRERYMRQMDLANYKFSNAKFTTRNHHYGLEAKVTGAGSIESLTIDSEVNRERFSEMPRRQQALILQSLVLEACNKAGELKRREMKAVYEQLFLDLYEDAELQEEEENAQRTQASIERSYGKRPDARGRQMQSTVFNMMNRDKRNMEKSNRMPPRSASESSTGGAQRKEASSEQQTIGDAREQSQGQAQGARGQTQSDKPNMGLNRRNLFQRWDNNKNSATNNSRTRTFGRARPNEDRAPRFNNRAQGENRSERNRDGSMFRRK